MNLDDLEYPKDVEGKESFSSIGKMKLIKMLNLFQPIEFSVPKFDRLGKIPLPKLFGSKITSRNHDDICSS